MHWTKAIGLAGLTGLTCCTVFAWVGLATNYTAALLMPMLATSCLVCGASVLLGSPPSATQWSRGEQEFSPIAPETPEAG